MDYLYVLNCLKIIFSFFDSQTAKKNISFYMLREIIIIGLNIADFNQNLSSWGLAPPVRVNLVDR